MPGRYVQPRGRCKLGSALRENALLDGSGLSYYRSTAFTTLVLKTQSSGHWTIQGIETQASYNGSMRPRIYIDTSVIGGCEDDEFRVHSRQLMEQFVRGDSVLVASLLTLQELAAAPKAVRDHLGHVPENHIEILQLDADAQRLSGLYIEEGVLSKKMLADAQHIAMATIARVDVLVSWNFKHIVNLFRIHGYNSVNIRLGYPILEIRAPREVIDDA